ncbi:MAG TPA: polysaccharide deacetylase family protein [Candidatus Binatia bacterium]|nr:polysaccharide deacetylase family protein [Candidatus Binatia bacterium]
MSKRFLLTMFLLALPSAFATDSLPVLLYHGIEGTQVPPEVFADQMAALHAAGYQTITTYEAIKFLQENRTLPDKAILLTFDDGKRTSYYPVDPILQKYDYKATAYLIGKASARERSSPGYLNASEVRQMLASRRWDVEAHANSSHAKIPIDASGTLAPYLTSKMLLANQSRLETDDEYVARLRAELTAANDVLETTFSTYVNSFAFPYGQYGQNPTNVPNAKDLILTKTRHRYSIALYQYFTGEGFSQNQPGLNTFMVKRIIVQPTWTGAQLVDVLQRGSSRALPFHDALDTNTGWDAMWGTNAFSGGSMTVKTNNGVSAMTLLDGSYPWKDDTYLVRIHGHRGTIGLVTRLQDRNNYATCDFTPTSIRLIERVNNIPVLRAQKSGSFTYPDDAVLTAQVAGNQASCSFNGTTVQGTLMNLTTKGGIGIRSVDATPNAAFVEVTEVSSS